MFQSAALAIVIKEWAFVIAVLRQHSFTTSVDAARHDDPLLSSRSQQQEQEEQQQQQRGDGGGGGGGGGGPRGGKSLYDSSGSYVDGRRHPRRNMTPGSDTRRMAGQKKSMWTGQQQVTCVRTLAIVYVSVFAVLCTSAFIVSQIFLFFYFFLQNYFFSRNLFFHFSSFIFF